MKERWQLLKKDLRDLRVPILVIALYEVVQLLFFHSFCPVRILLGLPCPGCGMTRAAFCLFTGHPAEAMQYHALVIPWVLYVLYRLCFRYVLMKKPRFDKVLLTALCVVTLIYYLYRMCVYYPSSEPMTYHENNILLF